MLTVADYYNAIDSFAPFSTAESWDNVGILIGGRTKPVSRALLALDLTLPVLEEAKKCGADLVITHHPVIFGTLKQIDADSVVHRAIEAGVAVISAHTNLDCAQGGVNDVLAERLQLGKVEPFHRVSQAPWRKVAVFVPATWGQTVYEAMAEAGAGKQGNYSHCGFFARGEGRFMPLENARPAVGAIGTVESVEEVRIEMLCADADLDKVIRAMREAHPYEEPAYDIYENYGLMRQVCLGRMGETQSPVAPADFAVFVKECLGAAGVRFVAGKDQISRVAVCGGSGADLLYEACQAGAHALVTAEAKHHLFLDAGRLGITLIDAGHFATENPVMEPLGHKLSRLLPEAAVTLSHCCTDGVQAV